MSRHAKHLSDTNNLGFTSLLMSKRFIRVFLFLVRFCTFHYKNLTKMSKTVRDQRLENTLCFTSMFAH